MRLILIILTLALCTPQMAHAAQGAQPPAPYSAPVSAQNKAWMPQELAHWQGWALYGQQAQLCPPLATDPEQRQCSFPTRAVLQAGPSGAGFQLTWRVFAPQFAPLPWAPGLWPTGVQAGGKPAAVLDQGGQPVLWLEPGEHTITGRLPWKTRPEAVALSPLTGIVELVLDGKPVAQPRFDESGSLEIARATPGQAGEETRQVKVFRLLRDGVPMTMVTFARVDVSGRARTILLDGLLPAGSVPMDVSSPVPLGFGPDGQVVIQAGAGQYDVRVTSRLEGQPKQAGPAAAPFGREIWSFEASPGLREIALRGALSADPQTTEMPEEWKRFPAYVMESGTTLAWDVIRQGEAGPRGDELFMRRFFWLDFSGKGFTVQDKVTGNLRGGWSMAMDAPAELGRVSVSGKDLPVVALGQEGQRGVVLRQSRLDMTAESRYLDAHASLPATGWQRNAASLAAEINLPPGWRVFHATGPDMVSQSWVGRWNLMTIFLTLFLTLVAWKTSGVTAATVFAAYLVLAQHEPGAPIEIWLPLLAAVGISAFLAGKSLEAGWSKAWCGIRWLHAAALVLVAAAALPFCASQVRVALHPQLEVLHNASVASMMDAAPRPAPSAAVPAQELAAMPGPQARERMELRKSAPIAQSYGGQSLEQDPSSLVQTGPGLPSWKWRTVILSWNGPVDASQRFALTLISPWLHSLFCVLRVLLLLASLWLLCGRASLTGGGAWGWCPGKQTGAGSRAGAAGATGLLGGVIAATLAALCSAAPATAADIPPKELLDEMRTRLTRPADCFPSCAGVSSMAVELDAHGLRIAIQAGTATPLALPLPVVSDGWRPQSVTIDGKPATLLAKENGLWVLAAEGAHNILLSGTPPAGATFSISSPLPPRLAAVQAPGWSVLGIGPDGALEGGLTFSRLAAKESKTAMTAVIPPFLEVERSLELGLTWEAVTTVNRLSRPGEPVALEIPLLPGESVLGQEVRVSGGKAVATLAAGQAQLSWRSRLDIAPSLELSAPEGAPWVESWRLNASPVWDLAFSGASMAASRDAQGQFGPHWKPWPGQKVLVSVSRPAAAPGKSLTIDKAALHLTPGARLDSAHLQVSLRSALGGRQVFLLPAASEVTAVTVAGKAAPWSSEKPGEIGLALAPGRQDIRIAWRAPREGLASVASPGVSLGSDAVNAQVSIDMPQDRWILWASGDTPLKPAILFWSALGAACVAALLLGRLPITPLGTFSWLLLCMGLTQVSAPAAVFSVLWLLALGVRRRWPPKGGWFGFNALQILLAVLWAGGIYCLFEAIRTGLLGSPEMRIMGNGSSARHLVWGFDRTGPQMPVAEVFSLSLWWYRAAMLAWALWLALSMLTWLRWAWESFSAGGAWRNPHISLMKAKKDGAQPPEPPKMRPGLSQTPQDSKNGQ